MKFRVQARLNRNPERASYAGGVAAISPGSRSARTRGFARALADANPGGVAEAAHVGTRTIGRGLGPRSSPAAFGAARERRARAPGVLGLCIKTHPKVGIERRVSRSHFAKCDRHPEGGGVDRLCLFSVVDRTPCWAAPRSAPRIRNI